MENKAGTLAQLTKGRNIGLRELGAELGSVTVILESGTVDGNPVDADVSVLLLDKDGRLRSDDDIVFYNQPVALGGAVHLRDKIGPEAEVSTATSTDMITLELDDVPDDVVSIVFAASLDLGLGVTFGELATITLRLQRSSDAQDLLTFPIEGASTETAMVFGEFYRRNTEWRVRAVGQGYDGGLAALIRAHGIEVTDDQDSTAGPVDNSGEDQAAADPTEATPVVDEEDRPADEPISGSSKTRPMSVRRPIRPPRMPSDWGQTIPADDGTDWQRARLFPVAGIGGQEEQERRATSALLSVMCLVKEFGRTLVARCGAPAGAVDAFLEVPFGLGDEAYRPDGVLRVARGQRTWQALVEVKTSEGRLKADQVSSYVDIAKEKGFDAVVTISNEVTAATEDSPVLVDRRKLKKVRLVHLPWDQVRTDAAVLLKANGVADATQRRVLEEFVRYMAHSRSGLHGFNDMGRQWVTVREAVRAKTLRSGDKMTAEVSDKFDQLMRNVALQLSALLAVAVQSIPPRQAPDAASRCQQLADSGLLFGTVRVPGAADLLVLGADLRAERVSCSMQVEAPRDGRQLTKVNWLLRQLPSEASDGVRIEALLTGPRATSTAVLLGVLRKSPEKLIPVDGREIRAFRVVMEAPIGGKRAAGPGGFIKSVRDLTNTFYAQVVQNIQRPTAKPPKIAPIGSPTDN